MLLMHNMPWAFFLVLYIETGAGSTFVSYLKVAVVSSQTHTYLTKCCLLGLSRMTLFTADTTKTCEAKSACDHLLTKLTSDNRWPAGLIQTCTFVYRLPMEKCHSMENALLAIHNRQLLDFCPLMTYKELYRFQPFRTLSKFVTCYCLTTLLCDKYNVIQKSVCVS